MVCLGYKIVDNMNKDNIIIIIIIIIIRIRIITTVTKTTTTTTTTTTKSKQHPRSWAEWVEVRVHASGDFSHRV